MGAAPEMMSSPPLPATPTTSASPRGSWKSRFARRGSKGGNTSSEGEQQQEESFKHQVATPRKSFKKKIGSGLGRLLTPTKKAESSNTQGTDAGGEDDISPQSDPPTPTVDKVSRIR